MKLNPDKIDYNGLRVYASSIAIRFNYSVAHGDFSIISVTLVIDPVILS